MRALGSLPRAAISLSVLSDSARAAVAAGGEVADLRGDALGHGASQIARVVQDAGVRAIVVDDAETADALRDAGVEAAVDLEADIDSALLYGLPGSSATAAMTLSGRVLSLKPLRAGEAVSYGYTHRAEHDTVVALVSGGYAQGIVRALGNNAQVEIDGTLRPIVGRVAMDVCVVDLQDSAAAVDIGSDVVFFGGTGPASEMLSSWTRSTGLRMSELIAVAGAKAVRQWAS